MSAYGTATLDFGAFPGSDTANVAITGQAGILGTSKVEAWIMPAATAEHSADEHMLGDLRVYAGNIVAGTGFTIYGVIDGRDIPPTTLDRANNANRLYGRYNIGWVWI